MGAKFSGSQDLLGLAVCERLAGKGVDLFIFNCDPERLASCQLQLRQAHDVSVDVCSGDIKRETDIDRTAAQIDAVGDGRIIVLNTPRPLSPMRDCIDEHDQARSDKGIVILPASLMAILEVAPKIRTVG